MSLLIIADSFYIGVLDVAAASSWYIQKLGLQQVPTEMDDGEGCVELAFSKKDQTCIALGPRTELTDSATPMLYSSDVNKAREVLSQSYSCHYGLDRSGDVEFEQHGSGNNKLVGSCYWRRCRNHNDYGQCSRSKRLSNSINVKRSIRKPSLH